MLMVNVWPFVILAVLIAPVTLSSDVLDSVRRAMVPTQPTAPLPCFLNYFLGNQMPQGLWNAANPSLRFICQTLGTTPGIDYYATVFDDNAGIAILSAYTVTATEANNIKSVQRPSNWQQTSGLSKQGNDALYYKNVDKADKGHLNPVQINSFDQNHVKATFTYSNAVPQYLGFNRGPWKTFEGRIVNYVQTMCAAKKPTGGKMYLMTGTSKFRLQIGAATPTQDPKSPRDVETSKTRRMEWNWHHMPAKTEEAKEMDRFCAGAEEDVDAWKTSSLCSMYFNDEDFTRLMNSGLNLKRELKQDDIGVCVYSSKHAMRKEDEDQELPSKRNREKRMISL